MGRLVPLRVVVLLPFCNAAPTLADAVESIRQQTFQEWELFLLNDGSTDGGAEIGSSFAKFDSRIRVLHLSPMGIVNALNHGMEHSKADVFARMDADDVCHPQRFEKQVSLLESCPEVGLVSCRVAFGGDREAHAGYARHVDWQNGLITHGDMFDHRFVDAPVAHPSVMFRRSVVEKYGGYREGDFPEDFEMWLRWMEAGVRFAKVPEILLTWNDAPTRLSRVDDRYSQDSFYRVKCDFLLRVLPKDRPIWLWGAGRPTRKRFELLDNERPFAGFVDIDPKKVGQKVTGRLVVHPEEIPDEAFVLLGVANPGAREKAIAFMRERGKKIGVDFLPVA